MKPIPLHSGTNLMVADTLAQTPEKSTSSQTKANNANQTHTSPSNDALIIKEKSHCNIWTKFSICTQSDNNNCNLARPASISNCDQTIELPDFLPADYKNIVLEITETIKNIPETFDDAEFNKKWTSYLFDLIDLLGWPSILIRVARFCHFLHDKAFKSKTVTFPNNISEKIMPVL